MDGWREGGKERARERRKRRIRREQEITSTRDTSTRYTLPILSPALTCVYVCVCVFYYCRT